jgi:hypothetical protein
MLISLSEIIVYIIDIQFYVHYVFFFFVQSNSYELQITTWIIAYAVVYLFPLIFGQNMARIYEFMIIRPIEIIFCFLSIY